MTTNKNAKDTAASHKYSNLRIKIKIEKFEFNISFNSSFI